MLDMPVPRARFGIGNFRAIESLHNSPDRLINGSHCSIARNHAGNRAVAFRR